MQLLEIEQPEFAQILTRNSITQSNFLQENKYIEQPQKIISNQQYVGWIFEECLDLSILRQKLERNDLKKSKRILYRSEIRYLSQNNGNEIDIEYHQKYKSYNLGCIIQNQRVDQFDISQHFLVALTDDGNLIIINMKQQLQIQSTQKSQTLLSSAQSLNKQKTCQQASKQFVKVDKKDHLGSSFVKIIMSENQSDYFYALDHNNNLYSICFSDGSVSIIFYIKNYNLFIGNHEGEKIRLIWLQGNGFLLYSHQNFLFYIETRENNTKQQQQTVSIKKSHFAKDLKFNLIVSQFNNNMFMINNSSSQRQYLLFAREIKTSDNSDQFFNQITKGMFQNLKDTATPSAQSNQRGGSSIEQFIQQFETKKSIYKLIKSAWSLKLCKLFNNSQNDYYYYFFSNYVISELQSYINQYQISLLDLLQVSVILLMQMQPSQVKLLLNQLDTIISDSRIKNEIWQKIWEFMPLYDVVRESKEPLYKQHYIDISKILETKNQINFLLKEQ